MIHIFLLILKILGMILLGILALLLLVILLVLFNPFSYRAEGTSDGSVDSAQAKAVFHWLFHLISGTVSYKESRFHWHIRLAWKHFGNDIQSPLLLTRKKKAVRIPFLPLCITKRIVLTMSFPTHFTRKRRIVIRSFPTLLTKRRRNASAVLLINNRLKLIQSQKAG